MSTLNKNQEYIISKFLEKYDYNSILEILDSLGIMDSDLYLLIKSCNYSMNFEFKKSLECIENISDDIKSKIEINNLIVNLKKFNTRRTRRYII